MLFRSPVNLIVGVDVVVDVHAIGFFTWLPLRRSRNMRRICVTEASLFVFLAKSVCGAFALFAS